VFAQSEATVFLSLALQRIGNAANTHNSLVDKNLSEGSKKNYLHFLVGVRDVLDDFSGITLGTFSNVHESE
jgi:hypothetical protein